MAFVSRILPPFRRKRRILGAGPPQPFIPCNCFLTLTYVDITILTEDSEVNERPSRPRPLTMGTLSMHLSSRIQWNHLPFWNMSHLTRLCTISLQFTLNGKFRFWSFGQEFRIPAHCGTFNLFLYFTGQLLIFEIFCLFYLVFFGFLYYKLMLFNCSSIPL